MKGFVAQHHVRAHEETLAILQKLQAQPIILVRNIFDHLVSLRDHIEKHGPCIPTAFILEDYDRLSDDEKFDYLTTFHVPWVFSFLASWWAAPANCLMISYEDLHRDTVGTLHTVVSELGLVFDEGETLDVIAAANGVSTLKNRMVLNRGDGLPSAVRDKIVGMARYYPSLPLNALGLQTRS